MADKNIITKIYRISIEGADDMVKKLETINTSIDKYKLMIRDAKKEKLANKEDIQEQERLNKVIAESEAEIKRLSAERRVAGKELQTYITGQQKLAEQQLKEQTAVKALPGSYNALYQEYKRLNQELRSTPDTAPNFQQLKDQVKTLKTQVDEFNRTFTKDGTLVGEYTTGILNAFKNAGLDDLIRNQGNQIKSAIDSLDKEFIDLQKEINKVGDSGDASFQELEKKLIDNRMQAEKLNMKYEEINVSLKGVGGIGSQVTESLNKNFSDIKRNAAEMIVGFTAFQSILSGIRDVVSINFNFEDSVNELKAITGVAGDDLEFLKQKALETSSRTKFAAGEILESFKLIASAKPELLQNVDALNQVKDAAVTLAQASGQTLPEAVDSITKALNQFGADASQSGQFVDALAAGAKFGAAEVPNITSALLEFGTQAKSTNVSIQESVGLIELLAEKGVQGAEAGTKLRNVLLTLNAAKALDKAALDSLKQAGVDIEVLSNTSLSLEQRLTELGKISNDNAALVKVFGKENFNAGQIVLQNIPRYSELAKQIGATGVANEQAAENTNSASVAWGKLRNQFQNFITSDNVTAVLSGIATVLSFFLANMQVTIPLLAVTVALTNTWIGAKLRLVGAFVFERTAQAIEIAQLAASNAIKTTATVITNIYTLSIIRSATATGAAAVAYRLLAGTIAFLSSPIGIVTGLIIAFTTVVGVLSSKAESASRSVGDLAKKQQEAAAVNRIYAEVSEKIVKSIGDQVSKIRQLTDVTSNSNLTDETRRKALDQLIKLSPKYRDALDGERINIEKVKAASDELIASLQKQARVKAIQATLDEKEKRIFENETKITTLPQDQGGTKEFLKGVAGYFNIGSGTNRQQYNELRAQIEQDKADRDAIMKLIEGDAELQNAIATQKGAGQAFDPIQSPTAQDTEAKKDKVKKSAVEILKAKYDAEKKELDTQLADKLIDEEEYNRTLLQKAAEYRNKKLQQIKLSNDEERKQAADLINALANDQATANEKLYDIEAKRLKDNFDLNKQALEEQLNLVTSDPKADDLKKTQARLDYYTGILDLQNQYNTDQTNLETQYKIKSVENERDRAQQIKQTRQKINEENYNLQREAYEKELRLAGEANQRQQDAITTNTAAQTISVLEDPNLGTKSQAAELKRIEAEQTKALLQQELDFTKEIYLAKLVAQRQGLASEQEVSEARKKMKLAELAVVKNASDQEKTYVQLLIGSLKDGLNNIAGFFKGVKASQQDIDDTLKAATDTIKSTMQQATQSYFTGQKEKADREKEAAVERLNIEEQGLLKAAQSENEKESIRRQFEKRRKEEEKKAAEEKKQIALKELALNFGVAVLKTLAAYPFPFSLLPVAALTIQYAIQRANVQSQKFERGGVPTKTGGPIVGPSHYQGGVKFNYEAEGDELAIINKKSAKSRRVYTVTGTPMQIASYINEVGGGVSFAKGAQGRKFAAGGVLGTNVGAPVLRSSNVVNYDDARQVVNRGVSDVAAAVAEVAAAVVSTNTRIDNIKVTLDPNEVRKENRSYTKQTDLATL